MFKKICALLLLVLPAVGFGQDLEHLTKDLRCFERSAFSALDLLMSSRESGGYVVMAEWSERVTSDRIVTKRFPLESTIQYVILLTTENGVDGTAIEIRDRRGERVKYEYKVSDLDRNQINLFFTPDRDDTYQLSFRVINEGKPETCMYMAILKGDKDPLEE